MRCLPAESQHDPAWPGPRRAPAECLGLAVLASPRCTIPGASISAGAGHGLPGWPAASADPGARRSASGLRTSDTRPGPALAFGIHPPACVVPAPARSAWASPRSYGWAQIRSSRRLHYWHQLSAGSLQDGWMLPLSGAECALGGRHQQHHQYRTTLVAIFYSWTLSLPLLQAPPTGWAQRMTLRQLAPAVTFKRLRFAHYGNRL